MAKSLNKVTLIGNLTRDPELRYTGQGIAVCSFSIATNRQWVTDGGEKKEDVEFHRVVAWRKLAEICAQFLAKGKKTYVEGRLQTRKWQTKEGQDRTTTEIVIRDMILLDSRGASSSQEQGQSFDIPEGAIDGDLGQTSSSKTTDVSAKKAKSDVSKTKTGTKTKSDDKKKASDDKDDSGDDDIPF